MGEQIGVLCRLDVPSEEAMQRLLDTRLDQASSELLDRIWGADFGDPPPRRTARVVLGVLAKLLEVGKGARWIELRGITTWDMFREQGRAIAAIAWAAHRAGGSGSLELEGDGINLVARVDVASWSLAKAPAVDLLRRLAPAPPPLPANVSAVPRTIAAVEETGAIDDETLAVLFDAIAPAKIDGSYRPHAPPVRQAVEILAHLHDKRVVAMAIARIPKTLDPYHGPKAILTADLVRILGAQGSELARKKIASLAARAKPKPRRPPGLVSQACSAALGEAPRTRR